VKNRINIKIWNATLAKRIMKKSDALPNPRMTMSQNENSEKTDIPKAQTQPKEGKSRLTKLTIVKQIPNFYLQNAHFLVTDKIMARKQSKISIPSRA
jgi:hypothetical protein